MTVPNLFIVGVVKGGTTALYEALAAQPEVYSPVIKEPHYFSSDIDPGLFRKDYLADHQIVRRAGERLVKPLAFVRDEAAYRALYAGGGNFKYLLDASTSYLFSTAEAENIFRFNPEARIICVVREPVSRVASHLMMDIRAGYCSAEADSLDLVRQDYESGTEKWGRDALYIDLCLYQKQLTRYFNVFPRHQVIVINYSTWNADQLRVKAALASWLGITFDVGHEALNGGRVNAAAGGLRFGVTPRSLFLLRLLTNKLPPVARRLGRRMLFDDSTRQELRNSKALANYVEAVCAEDWEFALKQVDL